jgi:hypothetical protein
MPNSQLRHVDPDYAALDFGCRIVQWVHIGVFLSGWIVAGIVGALWCLAA